jgi:L-threonylcarbamoyladenylate synthase
MLNTICEINNKYLEILADKFWPGPLTLILNKKNTVPDIVTAGGNTVGIRMPNHPVALEIIRKSGVPIAAPSANRSEEISPTTAQHVADSLGDNVDLILDGGSCEVGIESTVLDITCDIPRILRPGQISQAQIQEVLGMKLSHLTHSPNESISRSPGQMPRHYAPKKSLKIIASSKSSTTLNIIGISSDNQSTKVFEMSYSPRFYSQQLYACLRALDSDPSVVSIEVEAPPETPEWDAIWDRLRRASTPK